MAPATAGTVTNQTVTTISGGTPNYNISVINFLGGGTGLTSANVTNVPSTGVVTLNGVATASGDVSFQISATDSATPTANSITTGTFTIHVNASLALQPTTLNGATIGVTTNQTITVKFGTTPYTLLTVTGFSDGGTGLTAPVPSSTPGSTGTVTVTGTPTKEGLATFTVTVTDTAGATLSKIYTIAVFKFDVTLPGNVHSTTFGPITAIEPAFSQVEKITGGQLPYASIVVSNVLPGGTGLSGSNFKTDATAGTVTFSDTTPPSFATTSFPGLFTFNVVVTDANGNSFSTLNNVTVNPHTILFSPPDVPVTSGLPVINTFTFSPDDIASKPISHTITVTGGTPPYSTLNVTNFIAGTTTNGSISVAPSGPNTVMVSGNTAHSGVVTS